jgi:phosphate/phosphite/phosphonate ABC transporter binding protein
MADTIPPGAKGLVFALTWQKSAEPIGQRFADFTAWLGREANQKITPRVALSYEELARMFRAGEVDLAWLPPIVFVSLEQDKIAVPLVSHQRATQSSYESVLIVRADSKIRTLDGLRGTRAAWVDPWSAAGYVLPRIKLAALGVDPRTLFLDEKFFGSHDAVVRAVLSDKADVGGTFARLDRHGTVARGGWSEVKDAEGAIRVLTTFGPIPSDVTVARRTLPEDQQQALAHAMVKASREPSVKDVVHQIFGVEEFREDGIPSYETLRRALELARARGLLE